MRVRLTITLDIELRKPRPEQEPHETFESNGSLVESSPQPRYLGFTPNDL